MAVNDQLNTAGTPVAVTEGGTGVATFTTANGVLCSNTTATGVVVTAPPSTSGFVLTSTGSSTIPTFQAIPASPGGLASVQVTLTNTQFNAMYGAPVQIIAAQGASTFIFVDNIMINGVTTTTTFANGGPVGLQYGTTVHLGGTVIAPTVAANTFTTFTSSSNLNALVPNIYTPLAVLTSALANVGVYISNSGAAFTSGTSANVYVTVNYYVITMH